MSGHRRKKGHAEEHHVDERWLVSYADMITVLMALFIVLYAMSVVNDKKFDELKNALASGFGVTKSERVDANKSIVPKKYVHKNGHGLSATTLTQQQVAQEITKAIDKAGLSSTAKVSNGSESVTISLVGSRAYFDGNEAMLRPQTMQVLQAIEPDLKEHAPKSITIEGHADPEGSAGSYGNDWNLSSARATAVLVWLVDHRAVDPKSISAVGYGSEHSTAGDPAKNRRVDIVLHQASAGAAASTASSTPAATATATPKAKATATATPKATATANPKATASTSSHH